MQLFVSYPPISSAKLKTVFATLFVNFNVICKLSDKLEMIENDISKIEETSMFLPELEKKCKHLKDSYNN